MHQNSQRTMRRSSFREQRFTLIHANVRHRGKGISKGDRLQFSELLRGISDFNAEFKGKVAVVHDAFLVAMNSLYADQEFRQELFRRYKHLEESS